MSLATNKPYDPFYNSTSTSNGIYPGTIKSPGISAPGISPSPSPSKAPSPGKAPSPSKAPTPSPDQNKQEECNPEDGPDTKITGKTVTPYDNQTSPLSTSTSTPPTPVPAPAPSDSIPFSGSSASTDFSDIVKAVFNITTVTILFWLVTVYVVYRLGIAIFAERPVGTESSGQLAYSRTIDIVLALVLFLAFFGSYYNLPKSEQNNIVGYTIEWTYQFLNDPWSVFILIWFTIVFFFLLYILRVPTAPDVKPVLVRFVEIHIWIFYALFAIIFFFKYVLNIPIVDLLLNNSFMRYLEDLPASGSPSPAPSSTPSSSSSSSWWSGLSEDWNKLVGNTPINPPAPTQSSTSNTSTNAPAPSKDATYDTTNDFFTSTTPAPAPTPSPAPSSTPCKDRKQVFNIGENKYTYKQAQQVCKAFDAQLATYDQIEGAYNAGAEWCNYGWSEGQMAFFPTQKSTYNRLAQNPNTANACGRPGINGGYMANPNIRFGVNCYGTKPEEPTGWVPSEIICPSSCAPSSSPGKVPEDPAMNYLRKNAKITSFNNDEWSRY